MPPALSPPAPVPEAAKETLQLFPSPSARSEPQTPDGAPFSPAAPPAHKHRTVGNRIYDWGIYSTFAWAGVAAISALSAHEAMHGTHPAFNWLRSLNNNCISGLSKALESTVMKGAPKESIHGWAKGSTMFVTLGLGGWAMMAPIKWLEDHRERNAARIDTFLGTTPPDPGLVAAEVPQTWSSVLQGRLMSWGLSYAAFAAMGPAATGKVSDWFADKAARATLALRPQANPATVRKWADIAAFDATFTVITAAATYAFSRMFARRSWNPDHQEPSTLMTIDPATPTPLAPVTNPKEHSPAEDAPRRFTEMHRPQERPRAKSESFLKNTLESRNLASESPRLG